MTDLNKLKELAELCDSICASVDLNAAYFNFITSIEPRDVAELCYQLEKSQRRIAKLKKKYKDRTPTQWAYDQACAALEKHRERANLAEKELSALADVAGSNAARVKELERELAALRAKEPDGYIFCHPAGRLFWDVSDESKKDHKDVKPFYFNPAPVAVLDEKQALIKLPKIKHPAQFDYADEVIEVLTARGLTVDGGDDE